MNKPFKPLVILLALVMIGSFFSFKIPIREARATYVEGPIDKDTVWTLVDSPFVVSNDITIYLHKTLTIEPAVEVRFGGNFSIIVLGSLVAKGTESADIKFTSNSLDPKPGDWATIELGTAESSVLLSNCTVEYGTNGVTLENGSFIMEKSLVAFNSENGITIADGNAEVSNTNIDNNTRSGIHIEGTSHVSVHNNNITSNADGITLAGNSTSDIDIHQNCLYNNTHGMSLEAEVYDHTSILNNILWSNNYGFFVSTNTSTTIYHNYISNNTVGIFYGTGTSHEAHFNDIRDNEMGMDASPAANVDATYNYWGDRSGPNHKMLNPYGKGNPVGGNGANLNFIFFLRASIDQANELPTASLWADKLVVSLNQNVTFVGTNSQDEGSVDQYYYDFGDESSSNWTTLSLFTHNYTSIGPHDARLTVRDDFNETSQNNMKVTISVENLTSLAVALTLSNTTVNCNENVSATIYVSDERGPVGSANIVLYAVRGGSFSPAYGQTNSAGYLTTTFTAPNVTDITNVRIIARASKDTYADGSDYKYVKVFPPLEAQVIDKPESILSEENATLTISVLDAHGQPVTEALVTLETDMGSLSPNSIMTDLFGNVSFVFVAPQALSQFDATIRFRVQKQGFADFYGQTNIPIIPKELNLQVSVEPELTISENATAVIASVTFNSNPIPDATVTISSDSDGSFSNATVTTDPNGVAQFNYTAPRVTTPQNLTIAFTVTANKIGYVSDQTQATLVVMPKTLIVEVNAQPNATVSEADVNVNVHVVYSYDMSPLSEANVTLTSDSGGIFLNATVQTDAKGNAAFVFQAPPTNTPINVSISAFAEKTGYVSEHNQTIIGVEQGALIIRTESNTQPLSSGETAIITAFVTSRGNPVANASVSASSNFGTFDLQNSMTDATGMCRFIFTAPNTTQPLVATILSSASKNGYANAEGQLKLDVVPSTPQQTGGEFPLITLLMILIPVLIVIIVVVLIKMKVILVSFGEQEWE